MTKTEMLNKDLLLEFLNQGIGFYKNEILVADEDGMRQGEFAIKVIGGIIEAIEDNKFAVSDSNATDLSDKE